ncbi:sugar ABC transporter permease [Streptomyces sp. TRM72054]|uniref:carbohydrate ABC transporter permease n=1 Tax=Streptomyces sp. TRM72054 TaxID=2870562 RepID=UPI001C8BE0A9|nr:sugar ABC transporter permease [Streptomyces sp. TRM72054]MBX9399336.1 sugar ABC transporter permease [Streptomyces sp. TRM72054]
MSQASQAVRNRGRASAPSGARSGRPPEQQDDQSAALRRRAQNRRARRETLFGYAMVASALVVVVVFTVAPILASFVLALFKWDAISSPEFVGLDNFDALLSDESVTHSLLVTSGLAVIIVFLQVALGLGLALLVAQRASKIVQHLFRAAFFLPMLASAASISIVMAYVFNDQFGVINYYLDLLHLPEVSWLSSTGGATATIVLVAVWQQLGFTFILFAAALGSVPGDVLEAAQIDGASPARMFWRIKLPLISPTVLFASTVGLINTMQLFDQPYVMTKGGPGESTYTTVLLVYRTAFQNLQFGYASAISVVLFAVLLIITAVQFTVSRKWVFYS